ncbi:hypothetical protein TNCV_1789851 [Trichonephila clavipes]|nr:hypothetical protein TNCV_1789851 [Trichonephila clavipes]
MGKHKTKFYMNKALLKCPLTVNIVYRRSRCPNEVGAHFIMRCPFTSQGRKKARSSETMCFGKPTIAFSVPAGNKFFTSTQAQLLPSKSSVTVTSPSKSQPPNSVIDTVPTTSDNLSISAASSSSTACPVLETTTTTSNTIPNYIAGCKSNLKTP